MELTRIISHHRRFLFIQLRRRHVRNDCKCTANNSLYRSSGYKPVIFRQLKNYLCTNVHPEPVTNCNTFKDEINIDDVNVSVSSCIDNLSSYTDDQILKVIESTYRSYRKSPETFNNSEALKSLASKVDSECLSRAANLDSEKFVTFLRQHHQIGFIEKSQVLTYALRKRYESIVNGSLPCLLDYLRIMAENNCWRHGSFRPYELEYALDKHFASLQWGDIELFLRPLSVSQKSIVSDKLKKALCQKLIDEIDEVPEFSILYFFNLFCGQAISPHNPSFLTPWLVKIIKGLQKRIHLLSLECTSFIALLCSRMLIYDEQVLGEVALKLLSSLPTADVSDIERTIEALTFFNYHSASDFYMKLLDTMREDPLTKKLKDNPKLLCKILSHLSYVDVYPYDLIDLMFSKPVLKRAYKKLNEYNVPHELRLLAGGLKTESVANETRRLDFDPLIEHCLNHSKSFPKILRRNQLVDTQDCTKTCLGAPRYLSPYNRVLYCTRTLLDEMFGNIDYTNICFLSYFSRANIIFCLNNNGEPTKLPSRARNQLCIDRLPGRSKVHYHVVVFQSRNVYMDYEPFFMGEEIAKVRQLERFGCKIIGLPQQGWLKTSLDEKRSLLKKLIFENNNGV